MNKRIKNIIKQLYYSKIGRLIRKYPQNVILQKRCRECEKNIKKIDSRISKGIVRIVFILEMPEVWNSCKTVFEAFENMENAEAYILAVPKFPNTKLNPAYEFASIQYKNVIN